MVSSRFFPSKVGINARGMYIVMILSNIQKDRQHCLYCSACAAWVAIDEKSPVSIGPLTAKCGTSSSVERCVFYGRLSFLQKSIIHNCVR